MKGKILATGSSGGVVAGEDGNRYRFSPTDQMGKSALRVGQKVDFVIAEDGAKELYPIGPERGTGPILNLASIALWPMQEATAPALFRRLFGWGLLVLSLLILALPLFRLDGFFGSIPVYGLVIFTDGSWVLDATLFTMILAATLAFADRPRIATGLATLSALLFVAVSNQVPAGSDATPFFYLCLGGALAAAGYGAYVLYRQHGGAK